MAAPASRLSLVAAFIEIPPRRIVGSNIITVFHSWQIISKSECGRVLPGDSIAWRGDTLELIIRRLKGEAGWRLAPGFMQRLDPDEDRVRRRRTLRGRPASTRPAPGRMPASPWRARFECRSRPDRRARKSRARLARNRPLGFDPARNCEGRPSFGGCDGP